MTSRLRSQAGFTLVELMVVMLLVGVVGGVVTTAMIRGMRTSTLAQSRITALSDLQRGLERVARELRVADPLCVTAYDASAAASDPASDPDVEHTRLGASVYRDGKRYRHEFYLSGTGADQQLLQDVAVFDPPDAATGTIVSSGTFVANVGNDLLGVDLFTYYDQSNATPISTAAAARVEITLAKQVKGDDPVQITTSVEVRNTRYTDGSLSGGASEC